MSPQTWTTGQLGAAHRRWRPATCRAAGGREGPAGPFCNFMYACLRPPEAETTHPAPPWSWVPLLPAPLLRHQQDPLGPPPPPVKTCGAFLWGRLGAAPPQPPTPVSSLSPWQQPGGKSGFLKSWFPVAPSPESPPDNPPCSSLASGQPCSSPTLGAPWAPCAPALCGVSLTSPA